MRHFLVGALVLLAVGREPAAPPPRVADATEDGALRAQGGRLVIDEELRRFLDHHLAIDDGAQGELLAAFAARLPAGAAAEARELLDHYLDMRAAGRALGPVADAATRARQVRELRRDFLGDEVAAALFAGEEAELDAALARRRGEPVLTAAEAEALAPLATMQREAGLDAAAVQELRTGTFGAAATARLAELDRGRAAWKARLDAFRARRPGAGDPVSEERLLAELFTPTEQARVRALERLAGHPLDGEP